MVGFALHLFALRQQSYAITVRQEHICVCTISTLHTPAIWDRRWTRRQFVDDSLSFADMALGQASVLPGLGGSGPVEVIFFLVGISYLWAGCHVTRLKMVSGPEG